MEVAREMYRTLFDRIVHGRYDQETWLREGALAKEFGISRTPVRQVLRQLEQDGLLEIIPNRGARIFPFDADELEDLYEIRRSLEMLALEKGASSLSLQRLIELRGRVESLGDAADQHAALDAEIHSYLAEAGGSRRLQTMLRQLYRLIQTFRELAFHDPIVRETTTAEHGRLLDALCMRDTGAALEALSIHIRNSKNRVLTTVVRSGLTVESTERERIK